LSSTDDPLLQASGSMRFNIASNGALSFDVGAMYVKGRFLPQFRLGYGWTL